MNTLRDHINNYLLKIDKMEGKSEKTIRAYKSDLNGFCNYCEENEFGTMDQFKNFKQVDMDNFFMSLEISPSTFNRKKVSIINFINFLTLRELYSTKLEVKNRKVPVRDVVVLSKDETSRLLESLLKRPYKTPNGVIAHPNGRALSPQQKRNQAMMYVLVKCGLRAEECVTLKKENLINIDGVNLIRVIGKGDKERTVPMPDVVLDSINRWLEVRKHDSEYLFTRESNGVVQHVSKMLLKNKAREFYEMSGIDHSNFKKPCHILRGTCITRWLELGINPVKVQQMAGHSSFATTQRYIGKLGGDSEVLALMNM